MPLAALQVVVSRLRTALGPAAERVVAASGGYRLDAGPDETDRRATPRPCCATVGRRSGAATRPARPPSSSGRWPCGTGTPLEGLTSFPFAAEAIRRLDELRVSLVEARNDAMLVDGRHLEVLADIDAFADAHPLREHLRAQQVAALYRAGRQAEALRVCDALRRALRDELGIEPSPAMKDLERRVLDQDASLLATASGFMTPLPASTAEALPFVGRDAEYQQVLTGFDEAVRDGVRVVVVEGDAGIGKSRFLLQIAAPAGARTRSCSPFTCTTCSARRCTSSRALSQKRTCGSPTPSSRRSSTAFPSSPPTPRRVRKIASAFLSGRPTTSELPDERFLRHVAPWIVALSAKAPVVIVVDDLATVGSSFLRVVWQLTTLPTPKRVLIIGSVRTPLDYKAPSSALPRALSRSTGAACCAGSRSPRWSRPMSASVLERMYVARRDEVVGPLYELTGRQPLHARGGAQPRVAGAGDRALVVATPSPRRRTRQRTAELGRATAELLARASLFETDFTLEAIAKATGTSIGTAATLVDRAVQRERAPAEHAQLVLLLPPVVPPRARRRPVRLPTGRRSPRDRPHARRDRSPGRAARNALERGLRPRRAREGLPVPRARPGKSRCACSNRAPRPSGSRSRSRPPRQVHTWFAARATGRGPPTRRRPAEPRDVAGGGAAGAHHQRRPADTRDRAGVVGRLGVLAPLRRQAVCSTGRSRLADDDATRARILARQAVDLSVSDPPAAERVADEAVAVARRSHDASTLAEALLRRMSVSLAPHSLAARERALPELLEVSAESPDVSTRYFTLSTAVVTPIQTGDLAEVKHRSAEADAMAISYDLAPMRWSTMTRRAWRAGLAGRARARRSCIEEARDYGTATGDRGRRRRRTSCNAACCDGSRIA